MKTFIPLTPEYPENLIRLRKSAIEQLLDDVYQTLPEGSLVVSKTRGSPSVGLSAALHPDALLQRSHVERRPVLYPLSRIPALLDFLHTVARTEEDPTTEIIFTGNGASVTVYAAQVPSLCQALPVVAIYQKPLPSYTLSVQLY